MTLFREFVKIYKETGSVVWILILSISLPLAGTALSVVYIKDIENLLTNGGLAALGIFVVAATFLVGLSFLPSYILAVLCGWIFGFFNGTVICAAGIVLASLLGYWLTTFLVNEKVLEKLKGTERYHSLESYLKERKYTLITLISLMRVSPIFPFAVTNIILASLKINLKEFTAGTFAGMLPRTILAVFIGSQLTNLDFQKPAESWPLIVGLAATVLMLFLISRAAEKALKA